MQKSIRKKRDEFLLGIVGQFQESDENKTLFDCYDYVKIIAETTIDDFTSILSEEEQKVIERNIKAWFLPIESIRTFAIFLSNNEINLNR